MTGLLTSLRDATASLTVRFTAFIVLLAFVPIALLGWLALQSIAGAAREAAGQASITTARAAGRHLAAYVATATRDVQLMADTIDATQRADLLDPALRQFVFTHPHFRRASLIRGHEVIATSAIVARPKTLEPGPTADRIEGVMLSTVTTDDALLPAAQLIVGVPGTPSCVIVADLNLEYLWREVRGLDLPPQGHAILVDRDRRVLAHSDPASDAAVAGGVRLATHPLLRDPEARITTYASGDGVEWLAAGADLPGLNWRLLIEQPVQVIDRPAHAAMRQLAAALCFTGACTIIALVLVGRSLTRPLQHLTDATRALASGDRPAGVDVPRHRELGALARAFNEFVSRLTHLEGVVRRQEREAVLGKIGGGLLHDIAHPVRNIVNNARLLPRLSTTSQRDALQLIEREHAVIDELFDNLRAFTRTTPQRPAQAIEPDAFLRDVAARLRHDAEMRGVPLRADIGDAPAGASGPPSASEPAFAWPSSRGSGDTGALAPEQVMTDPSALRRVLRNLVLNAIEAAYATGGQVTLSVRRSDASLQFIVEDTGPGLAPAALASLFDGFHSTKRNGLGLGLATARRLVEQMGGTLTATSVAGAGTSCIVTLPRRREPRERIEIS